MSLSLSNIWICRKCGRIVDRGDSDRWKTQRGEMLGQEREWIGCLSTW